jgi:hypothetical protein
MIQEGKGEWLEDTERKKRERITKSGKTKRLKERGGKVRKRTD